MLNFRLVIVLYCFCGLSIADVSKTENKETGLIGWKLKHISLELELIQRLPDQTRAFFMARGFPAKIADDLGRSCIFQTILRNVGLATALTVSLKDWTVYQADTSQPVKLKEVWDKSWPDKILNKSARLAFRWATFPTIQTFQSGDYNWGMISFGLPAGENFDLQLVWKEDNKIYTSRIESLSCADDK